MPVFYLKGFTKESELLKIYNTQEKRFLKNGKEFSPKTFFFEKNANTIFVGSFKNDFLEHSYGKFDNEMSLLIEKINSSDHRTRFNVTEDDMPRINHFVSLMYWRLPQNKDDLSDFIKANDLNSLGLSIINSDGSKNLESQDKFKNDIEFVKAYRYYNSLMDSLRGAECRTPYTILSRPQQLPFLCSDSPIIFENEKPVVYLDDYIFPLSGTRIFLKCNRSNNFPGYLWMLIDIVLILQANKFVGCTSEKYIDELLNCFQKYNITLEETKREIFKHLK